MNFIFGGDTGLTYDQLQRKKQIADQLMAAGRGGSRTASEGISNAARQITGALMARRADKQEQAQRQQFQDQFAQAFPQASTPQATMYDSPFANDRQKRAIAASLAGVPGFRRGTAYAPGGPAVVGEEGPELVYLPEGSQVIPNPQTLAQSLPQAAAPALSPSRQMELNDLSEQERQRIMRMLSDGISEDEAFAPDQKDMRQMIAPDQGASLSNLLGEIPRRENRFDGARAVQVADTSGRSGLPDGEPAPSPQELQEIGQRVGIDPEALQGLELNATEAKNFGYLLRMMEAEKVIRELEGSNTWGQRALELLPGRDLESMFQSPEYRRYLLARENFNEAALRSATGATINQQEMPMQRQNYFPTPSDDEETKELLRRQRQALMMSLTAGSGPAAAVIPEYGQAVVPADQPQRNLGEMSDEELMKMLQGGN